MQNEAKYENIKREILGDSSSDEEDDDEEESEEEEEEEAQGEIVKDLTESEKINLRRTIYLTIMSSVDFEECAHKLMKVEIPEGREVSGTCSLRRTNCPAGRALYNVD